MNPREITGSPVQFGIRHREAPGRVRALLSQDPVPVRKLSSLIFAEGVASGVAEGVAEGVLEAGLLLSRNVELEVLDGRLPSWNVFCLLAGDPELSGKVEFGVNWYSVLVDKHRPVFGSISSNFSTSLFTDKLFPDNVFPPVPVLYPISSQEI